MNEQPGTPDQGDDPGRQAQGGRQPRDPAQQPDDVEQAGVWRSETGRNPDRLPPRPVLRPEVDSAQQAAFARPPGVDGSFASDHERHEPRGVQQKPPAPESLAQAFSRPPGNDEVLQRAPGESNRQSRPAAEQAFWDADAHGGWRDPAAGAVIGPPARSAEPGTDADQPRGRLLSAREVLFGKRVQPRALIALGAVAVLLGLGGGFIGRITAEEGNPLVNPDVTLSEVQPGGDRPQGSAASVAQQIVPAVVSVEVRIGGQGGTGSGVVIDGDGYVITNNHVVSMASDTPDAQVSAVFHDGTRVPARVVGRDVKTDLAVIKVDIANPTVAQLGTSDDLSVGDQVTAVGSPLGLQGTVTTGIISSVSRPLRLAGEGTDTNAVIDAIQTDAAINPGNSGGALVDGNGAVVGINSAIRTLGSADGEGGSIGLGFAIPINDARRIAQEIIRTGTAEHADLGVNAKSVSDGLADGAQVQNVREGSAAAGAGIAEGDVVIKVGDRDVHNADELIVAVDRHRIGERVPITVVRQGRELVLEAALR